MGFYPDLQSKLKQIGQKAPDSEVWPQGRIQDLSKGGGKIFKEQKNS